MAQGSAGDMRAQYAADFDTMETKFVELAGAMDAGMYDWRPMDGVRTVSEVFMLIVAENYFVPAAWGAAPPDGITPGFALFGELAEVTDKRDVLDQLEKVGRVPARGGRRPVPRTDARDGPDVRPGRHPGGISVAGRRGHARAPGSGHRVRPHEQGGSTVDGAPGPIASAPRRSSVRCAGRGRDESRR